MNTFVSKAAHWALIYHEQQLYGDQPYINHLQDVVNVLLEFSFDDENLLAVGWLHDILEDTSCPRMLLLHEFGEEITQLVHAVTDGEGDTRKKRKAIAYQKIQELPEASIILSSWLTELPM